jgi:putative ABC transport system permease protein
MQSAIQDVRYAIRSFTRRPALTLAAVLSLGMGIGAMATVFTWLQGMVLNPLPAIPEWDRVVAAYTRAPQGERWSVSWPDFEDWRRGARTVDLAAWDMLPVGLRDGKGPAERAWGLLVSGNYFEDLRVGAELGRVLRPEDETERRPVAVLGYRYWQRRFGGDPGVIGRTITLNGSAFTIVGVAARRFVGNYVAMDMHLYLPMTTWPLLASDGATLLEDRQRRSIDVIGRLASGATLEQAAAEVDALARRAGEAAGVTPPLGAIVRLHRDVDAPGAMRPLLGGLLGATGLMLLVACANVASLLLARAIARRREIAVRLAIGASRARLVRQLLTESMALAALSGGAGLAIAYWARDGLLALLPTVPYPVFFDFNLDARVLLFATLVTASAALAFGLVPALQASRPDLGPSLKDEIGAGSGGRGRLQSALVVAQVALSLTALVAAGLFVRSVRYVRSIDTGMSALDRVLLVNTDLDLSGQRGAGRRVAMVHSLLERVRALPGVEAASVARAVPLGPAPLRTAETRIEGYAPPTPDRIMVSHNDVGDGYFETTGIRLLEGRTFTEADTDGNAPVAIVNEAFARRFLAGRPAIGARLSQGGEWLRIVGVVATTRVDDYLEPPHPLVYRPYSLRHAPSAFALHVRAAGDPLALTAAVRRAFAEAGPELPFLDPRSMAEFVTIPFYPQRLGATVLAVVGVIALLLAAIGTYGTMAYSVSRRVREIGVRVALGAARRDVLALVLGRAVRLAGTGLALGVVAAFGVGRLLQSQLVGVNGADPVTFGVVVMLLGVVALLASFVPAYRAARIPAMVALRHE